MKASTSICEWVSLHYNDRQYEHRGWCCFEAAVSVSLTARLNSDSYPKMRSALGNLPPKVLALSSMGPPEPLRLEENEARQSVERAVERIGAAQFTGKADKPSERATQTAVPQHCETPPLMPCCCRLLRTRQR